MQQNRYSVCVATGTRAEFGLLLPLLRAIQKEPLFELRLLVTGMHLCREFGLTYQEIEASGIPIDEPIEMMLASDTSAGMAKSAGLGMILFADYFQRRRPDLLVVLGDRFEIFACAAAAALEQVPIAHLYAGDATEGQVDEFIRHSITKMSQLHFAATETARRRVIQLGEHPDHVFNFGALSVENALHLPLLTRAELEESLGWPLGDSYAVVTFHPVTLESGSAAGQLKELFAALDATAGMRFLFTKANSDASGRQINEMLDEYVAARPHCAAFPSLGIRRYLTAVKYSRAVIGNSSSGLYEPPSFGVPTVNIGDRQRGREQADSVVNCPPERGAIREAVREALSPEGAARARRTVSPYGDGNTSARIVEVLRDTLAQGPIDVKKRFYNLSDAPSGLPPLRPEGSGRASHNG